MRTALSGLFLLGLTTLMSAGAPAELPPLTAERAASLFGALEEVQQISLSPDGTKVAYVAPASNGRSMVMVGPTDGPAKPVVLADGKPFSLHGCGWSAIDRLVCREYAVTDAQGMLMGFTRMISLNSDGTHVASLSRHNLGDALRISQFNGAIIDWMSGSDGTVLMQRDFVPEKSIGTLVANTEDGFGVERVDTRTLRATKVEKARRNASHYISDGRGNVRIVALDRMSGDEALLTGKTTYLFRAADGRGGWRELCTNDVGDHGIEPIAVDPTLDVAYVLKPLDGRRALYRMSLDGNGTLELAYANPKVDVDDVVQVGRAARVIGATYVTEERHMIFFDPTYEKLVASLSKAIPKLPLISFAGASADENILLLRAGSDVEPGSYFVLDRAKKQMHELVAERLLLSSELLAPVKPVSFRATDGTMIPAYLTVPRGGGRKLPAIVLPHGGPASRDEWGFDWLAQFYAARGFVVLQPEFRGSAGFGDGWFVQNGFKSWRTAIGDVTSAGRWLVSEGIADPAKLAILGWSYGGYAALQAAATEPDLFKAVVAVAPVTDLAMLKGESADFTNTAITTAFIGSGPHVIEGSPLQHAAAIKAPVLMFHGDKDINVAINESRAMQAALTRAGRKSDLIVYPGLDHQLHDGTARTDMLGKSDAFLHQTLGF